MKLKKQTSHPEAPIRSGNSRVLLAIGLLLLSSLSAATETEPDNEALDRLERTSELDRHEQLMRCIAKPDSRLSAFHTDGCSGDLSEGWESFGAMLGEFRETHGTNPPWQSCCVEHDKLYHTSRTPDSTAELLCKNRARRNGRRVTGM